MALQVWLPLNGNLDNQGLSNVQITNVGATVNTGGKIGQCYSFDGSQYITLVSNDIQDIFQSPQSCFSMACWIYLNSDETDRVIIFGNYSANPFINWELSASCAQRLCAGGTSNYTNKSNSYVIPKEEWTHIAVTYDGNLTTFYVDGILQGAYSGANTMSTKTASNTFWLGSDARSGATRLKGKMNDFRLYDHTLSSIEVKHISQGLVLHLPLNNSGFGQENIIDGTFSEERSWTYPSSGYSDKFSKITTIIPSKEKYTLSFYAKSTVNGDKVRTHYYSPNTTTTCVRNDGYTKTASDGNMDFELSTSWQRYWVTYTQTSTTSVKHIICPRLVSGNGSGTVSIKMIKFEEGDTPTPWCPNSADTSYTTLGLNNNIEYDVSGYGNNGTRIGTISTVSDSPRYMTSTLIGSTSSHIKISGLNTSGFANSYSFSWWGKPSDFSNKMMWGFSNGVRLNGVYNGNLWNTGDGSNNPIYTPGTTTQVTAPSSNIWHHFVMTGNGSVNYLYVDGVLYGQSKTYKSISGTEIYINGWTNATNYTYSGLQMSDFRIYATALSADDVMALYKNAAYVDSSGNVYAYELNEN